MICTSLNKIRECAPCKREWKKLLAHLGKTKADDEPLPFSVIVKSNGLDDALWACRTTPEYDHEWRLFAIWCARQIQHLIIDHQSVHALDVAERNANGQATDKELHTAQNAARNAAWAAAEAAQAAVEAAASAAASAAAWAAAWAVAWAAGAAALDAAFSAQQAAGLAARAAAGNAAAWDAATAAASAAANAARDAQTQKFLDVVSSARGGRNEQEVQT